MGYAKLFVRDIFDLRRGTGKSADEDASYHFMGSVRLEFVQIVGTVVKVKEKTKHDVIGIDDGSGVIEVLRWHADSNGHNENIGKLPRLGDSVRVCGKLKYPNWSGASGIREINVDRLCVLRDPNFELLFWLQTVKLGETVYSKFRKKRKACHRVRFAEPIESRRRIVNSTKTSSSSGSSKRPTKMLSSSEVSALI